jgi:MoaA/NifB/PqqE/SkfB family radical SAM enzyme
MPISLKIEPSAMCQLACPGCVQSDPLFKLQAGGKLMTPKVFERILQQASKYIYRIQFYRYGEPFINRQLIDMISLATSHDIGSQVSTNLSFAFSDEFYRRIVESGLEHLIISMDGTSSETYSQYRVKGHFELVESGMRQVIKWKRLLGRRFPLIEWQFIVFDHNRHEIDNARQLAKKIGVDRLCLKYDGRGDRSKWRTRDSLKDKLVRQVHLNSCLWLWAALVIDSDGIVSPCCHGARDESIGDLTVTPLEELWNSARMKDLRRCVREGSRHPGEGSSRMPCVGCQHIL